METSAHVWASTLVVLVLIKSALHQRFGRWSGLHLNLTELMEILGEILKEFTYLRCVPKHMFVSQVFWT